MQHPLHIAVAKEIQKRLNVRGQLYRDLACGGEQQLPLFIGAFKAADNHMCDVDLLVVSDGRVRVIIEIEESSFIPTRICGKFLQAAIATHFILDARPENVFPYGNRVAFIQVLDGSKGARQSSHKIQQGKLIQKQIRGLLPLKGSSITDYHLFFVQGVSDSAGLEFVGEMGSNFHT